jgi:mRNA interferase RelE/StbE
MKILITSKAKKQIQKLPQIVKIAVDSKIRGLLQDQQNLQIKKMKEHIDMYRVRVGRYRIVYQKTEDFIRIVVVQHRKDVYREL